MKTRLSQLTLSQFVDLLCGDTDVLLAPHEVANKANLAKAMRDIILEYRNIADPGGVEVYLRQSDDIVKARMAVVVFSVCSNLVAAKRYDAVRSILQACGNDASQWPDKRIKGTIKANLEKAKRRVAELEAEDAEGNMSEEDVRNAFDGMTASLMAHFKFQIDPDTIKATLYANLVARHNKEVKAQLTALKRM